MHSSESHLLSDTRILTLRQCFTPGSESMCADDFQLLALRPEQEQPPCPMILASSTKLQTQSDSVSLKCSPHKLESRDDYVPSKYAQPPFVSLLINSDSYRVPYCVNASEGP